jgi:small-conductance mechanosensitive channel
VRARLAFLAGGAAVAGAAVYRFLRRAPAAPAPVEDTHAEELRAKLAESRAVVEDREEFDSAETPVDEAEEAVAPELGDRRRAVHARARHVAEEMRRGSDT